MDTLLSLEGYLQDRQKAYARNRPLSEFFEYLPKLAQRRLVEHQRQDVAFMADEILRVKFDPPDEFEEDIEFLPLGIPGHKRVPDNDEAKRVLIVSPFLNDPTALWLTEKGQDNILISRPESFDAIAAKTIKRLEKNTTLFFLDDAADRPQENREAEADADDSSTVVQGDDFSGLHAKLYIIENGWNATVFSGSANATSAAMGGLNVELLVGMTGKKAEWALRYSWATIRAP